MRGARARARALSPPSFRRYARVAVTRLVALGPSLAVCIATGSDTGLFNAINEWLNILQSIQLPFAMLPILHFSSDPRVMRRFTNGRASKAAVYALAILVMVVNVVLIAQFVLDETSPVPHTWWFYVIVVAYARARARAFRSRPSRMKLSPPSPSRYACMYFGFLAFLVPDELRAARSWITSGKDSDGGDVSLNRPMYSAVEEDR